MCLVAVAGDEGGTGDNCTKPVMPITITAVSLPYGWLGNMAPFPILYDGKEWRTTEALFQSLRFDDDGVKEEIRAEKSPMGAKFVAKREKDKIVVVPQCQQDLANMEMVLRLKLGQHPELRQKLLDTGDEIIIEDCSMRSGGSGTFWGAAMRDGKWEGQNILGKLWMKLREELLQSKKSRN